MMDDDRPLFLLSDEAISQSADVARKSIVTEPRCARRSKMWESPTILTPVFSELLRSQSQVPGMLDLKHPAGNIPSASLLFRLKLSECPDLAFVGWQSLCAIAPIFRFRPSRKCL